jgi:two-component system sensor histidine kinase RegB
MAINYLHARARGGTVVASSLAPPPMSSLRLLMALRAIAVAGQVAAIAAAAALGVALPVAAMATVIALLVVLEAVAWLRVKAPRPVTRAEIGVHLLLDLAAFTALIILSGGVANPFSLFFVLHVVLFALLLSPLPATAGLAAVLLVYSLLTSAGLSLRMESGQPLAPALHVLGQWLSLVLTAVVAAWFVTRNVALLREHHRLLLAAAQKAQNDDAILRVGALAAGAAHELSSPLSVMSVVAGEIQREAQSPSLRRDAGILATQIEACRRTLTNLLTAAGHTRAEGGGRQRLDAFLATVVDRFRLMRPDASVVIEEMPRARAPDVYADSALQQAILVLLDNAADVSPDHVRLSASWDSDTVRITVDDRGEGIAAADLDALGRVFFTTKPPGEGTGLGLVLAADAVHALDGTLSWKPRADGGTAAQMMLPLRALRLPQPA